MLSSGCRNSQRCLTLYRRFGQGRGCGFVSFLRFLRWARSEAGGSGHRSLLWRRKVGLGESRCCAAWEMGTSYLSIDSSRSSDGRLACEVRDAVWGPRSGASRNLGNDVRASDAGSSTRVFKHHAVIASRWVLLASRSRAHGEGRCYMAATLDVLARETRLGVRSRR
jgi:hypothetical protein